MFTLKNCSGSDLELRNLKGGTFVSANAFVDIDEKLHDETDDAYFTVRVEKNLTGRDEHGSLVWEDEEVLTAWPKQNWSKVTRESKTEESKTEDKPSSRQEKK